MSLPNNSARILIADDDANVRGVLNDFLSQRYECTAVGSAEQALALLGAERFQLVLSDISMEGMSGLELIPHVRSLAPDAVIVMVSGSQTTESAVEAMRAGAFDYVIKPFDLEHLEVAVGRALEHQRLVESKQRYEGYLESVIEQRTGQLDRALQSLEDAYRTTLKALINALETRDAETHGHSERVVAFSLRLGREMGLGDEQLTALEFGSLLHDIGKIGVPDAILRKPAALTEDEWAEMRLHPAHGRQILCDIEFLEGASRVVAQHHEKWDGSGYPLGLKGEEIDLNARIFAVADAFDAMTTDRVYRGGRAYELANAELERCAGKQFDPSVVEAFKRIPREEWDELRRRRTSERCAQTLTTDSATELRACARAALYRRSARAGWRAENSTSGRALDISQPSDLEVPCPPARCARADTKVAVFSRPAGVSLQETCGAAAKKRRQKKKVGVYLMEVERSESPVVMLVEDFEDTRQMLRRMLEISGCRVLEAANGQEAIGLLPHGEFDLVLMDLNMPVLDGFTATLRIREDMRTRDVPVVAVTAYDTQESRAAAVAVGCCEYVVKPLDFDRLSELLDRLIPPRRRARAAAQD